MLLVLSATTTKRKSVAFFCVTFIALVALVALVAWLLGCLVAWFVVQTGYYNSSDNITAKIMNWSVGPTAKIRWRFDDD
jgi:uncharacterized Tic20 family protein